MAWHHENAVRASMRCRIMFFVNAVAHELEITVLHMDGTF